MSKEVLILMWICMSCYLTGLLACIYFAIKTLFFTKQRGVFYILFILLLSGTQALVATNIFKTESKINLSVSAFTLIEFIALTLYFLKSLPNTFKKKLYILLMIVYNFFALLFLIQTKSLDSENNWVAYFPNFLLIAIAIDYIYRSLDSENLFKTADFWVAVAIIFLKICSTPILIASSYLPIEYLKSFHFVENSINLFLYGIFFFLILKSMKCRIVDFKSSL